MDAEQLLKTCETWSDVVSLALRRTPRTVTPSAHSMKDFEGGCMDLDLARVKTSSFVLNGWIFMLLFSAHFLMLSYSSYNVCSLNLPTGKTSVVGKYCYGVLSVTGDEDQRPH